MDVVDKKYAEMALQLRELAMRKYGCLEFTSTTEGTQEIAISYWKNQQQIEQWKNDAEHQIAQKLGRSRWYKSYKIQVVEIIREYEY